MLDEVVDLLCLVYHEARNVRHPIKKGLIDSTLYKALVNLPTGRGKAWVAMESTRSRKHSKCGDSGWPT